MSRPVSVVLAGGGSAGHVSPLLATADALRPAGARHRRHRARHRPRAGGDARPGPRLPAGAGAAGAGAAPADASALLRLPGRLRAAVARPRPRCWSGCGADVLVGFGGYVSAPAYLAARRRGTPIVVHEANPRPGLANRLGARLAARVATATDGVPLPGAETVGLPLRREVATLDRAARRAEGRALFGLDAEPPALLVTGGSQGARTLNTAALGAAAALAAAGVQVLHAAGPRQRPRAAGRCRPARRRTCWCRTWSGWSWPTRRPTWCCAGPARTPAPS